MVRNIFLVVSFSVLMANPLCPQQPVSNLNLGDCVSVEITGDLARKYVSLIGLNTPPEDFMVPVICTVERKLDGNRIEFKGERIEVNHAAIRLNENDKTRMMTLVATIHMKDLKQPSGYSQLHAFNATRTPEEHATLVRSIEIAKMPTIRLTSTGGIKIRSWALTGEIGD